MTEQPMFCIGDRIVCADSKGYESLITEGKTYKVTGVVRCKGCGIIGVSVGVCDGNIYQGLSCRCASRQDYGTIMTEAYFKQTRFVPIDFDRMADEVIFESLKGIPETKTI